MPLMPSKNYVLTQKVEEKKTVGSLIIPDSSKNKHVKAVIIATDANDYEKGDVIYYEKLRDRELTDDEGNTFYLVHEDHILAKII